MVYERWKRKYEDKRGLVREREGWGILILKNFKKKMITFWEKKNVIIEEKRREEKL